MQAVVDLFTPLVYAENRAGPGLAETPLCASQEASENPRYALEAAKGRAVIRGTGMAVTFEIQPILMSVLSPVAISLGVDLLGIPWFQWPSIANRHSSTAGSVI